MLRISSLQRKPSHYILKCIEAEKPVLRHQILPEHKNALARFGSDATGETGITHRMTAFSSEWTQGVLFTVKVQPKHQD